MKNKPTFSNLLRRSLKLSVINIWRNKVLSIATIFVTAIIIFIFNIILAINFITQDALTDLNKKIDVVVYLKESTPYEQIQAMVNDFKTFKGVDKVTFTSKADALNQLEKTHPNITVAFQKYGLENPLPASINITTIHPKYHRSVSNQLSQDKYKAYLSNVLTNENTENNPIISKVSENLLHVSNFTEQVIFWLIITFILGGSLIILNALQITIFTRKKEIGIMKLVGASNWFIRSPFMIEAAIYGILAAITSFLMLYILSSNIAIQGTELWNYFNNINFTRIFIAEAIITILLSVASSVIAIHEYVQNDLVESQ